MTPWMSPQEIDLIKRYLRPTDVMLEWGSGGSTVTFSPLVKSYYSIEHVSDWYTKVDEELQRLNLSEKVTNVLIEPDSPRTIPTKYEEFKTYIEYVDGLGITFDRVLIDGRARAQCAERVLPYLSSDAIVFIHDFWARPQYHNVLSFYEEVSSVKFGQSIVALKKKDYEDFVYPAFT